MKKILVLFVMFILSISFASASFWGNSWKFVITTNAVAEEPGSAAAILEGEEGSSESAPAEESSSEPVASEGESSGEETTSEDSSQTDSSSESEAASEEQKPEDYQEQPYPGDQGQYYQGEQKPYPGDQRQYYQDGGQPYPGGDQGQYQGNYPEFRGTYCGDGNCDLQDGEQYSWCPQDCDESQTQDSYRGNFKEDHSQKFGAPPQQRYGAPSQGQNEQFQCPDETMLAEMTAKCEENGGSATERTDPYNGCVISECFFQGGMGRGQFSQGQGDMFGGGACQSEEEAEEQSTLCEELGSEAIAVPSPPGCAPRIVCAQQGQGYGSGHLSYDEYREGQDKFESGELGSAQVLEAILKMDSIKIQLDGVQKKMEGIAGYYESQGDTESAENYRNGAAILDQVAAKVDEQKTALKEAVEAGTLDYDTIYQIRSDLKYSVDELLNQVISALLGVDYTGIAKEAASGSDCGSNGLCFEEYFRSCAAGASFNPDQYVTISISEITEEDECVLSVSTPMGSASCNVPNYRYATLSKESVMPYCDDTLQGMFEQYEQYSGNEDYSEESVEETTEEIATEEVVEETAEESGETIEETVVEEEVVEEAVEDETTGTETEEAEEEVVT